MINNLLKKAETILVTDSDNFNKDISLCCSLMDVRHALNLAFNTRLVKVLECGNRHGYRVENSTYTFELTII